MIIVLPVWWHFKTSGFGTIIYSHSGGLAKLIHYNGNALVFFSWFELKYFITITTFTFWKVNLPITVFVHFKFYNNVNWVKYCFSTQSVTAF